MDGSDWPFVRSYWMSTFRLTFVRLNREKTEQKWNGARFRPLSASNQIYPQNPRKFFKKTRKKRRQGSKVSISSRNSSGNPERETSIGWLDDGCRVEGTKVSVMTIYPLLLSNFISLCFLPWLKKLEFELGSRCCGGMRGNNPVEMGNFCGFWGILSFLSWKLGSVELGFTLS